MDLVEAALQPGNGAGVDTALTPVVDAVRQSLDLDLKRVHRPLRQRAGDQICELGQVGANAFDRCFKIARWPQCFDSRRDIAKLQVEMAQVEDRLRRWRREYWRRNVSLRGRL